MYQIEAIPVPANAGFGYLTDSISGLFLNVSKEYADGNHKACWISGDSMEPLVPNGAWIIYNVKRIPKHGDIIIALVNNELLCKRLIFPDDPTNHERFLVSENKNYSPKKINGFDTTEILGVAVEVRRAL